MKRLYHHDLRIDEIVRYGIYLLSAFLCLLMLMHIGMYEQEEMYYKEPIKVYDELLTDNYARVEDPNTALGFYEEYRWSLSSQQEKNTFLIFYTIHHYTDVYVDEELILSLDENEANSISHGVGGKWLYVPLHLHSGETEIRVVSEPIYKNVVHRQPEFFIGDPVTLFRDVRTDDIESIMISILGIAFGLCAILLWLGLLVFRKKNISAMAYLGLLLLLLSVCRLSGMRSSSVIFSVSSALFGYMSNFSMLMAWMTFHLFIDKRYSDYSSKWFTAFELCCFIVVAVILMLQGLGFTELRNLMWIIHIGIVLDLIAVGIIAYHQMRLNPNVHTKLDFLFGMLLTGGVFADLIRLYAYGISRSIFFTFFAFLVYIVYIATRYLFKLQTDAYHDRLTGLYNRRGWEHKSAQADSEGVIYGLLMIDLNNLKLINDNIGHSAGDKLLVEFSKALKRVMHKDWDIFRIGGDEFLVFIPKATPEMISSAVKDLHIYVSEHNSRTDSIRISYSLGSVFSGDYLDMNTSDILAIADERMYEDKRSKSKSENRTSCAYDMVK